MNDALVSALAQNGIGKRDVSVLNKENPSFHAIHVRGDEAYCSWAHLRDRTHETGFWPVVVGHDHELPDLEFDDINPREVLKLADSVDVDAWYAEREAEDGEFLRQEREECQGREWPAKPARTEPDLRIAKEWAGGSWHNLQFMDQCTLALVPTTDPLDGAAYFWIGGLNWNPREHVHIAVWRRWRERFGLGLLAVNSDAVELTVERPPTTHEESLRLAREHYLYCHDLSGQVYGSLHELAVALWRAPSWYFWWD